MQPVAIVLSLLAAIQPGAERVTDRAVVDAIAAAAESPLEASELAVYAWLESSGKTHPRAFSWDARAGVSCGPWQLRCSLSRTPAEDAKQWIAIVRAHGLVAVDGSRSRAERRERQAIGALVGAMGR